MLLHRLAGGGRRVGAARAGARSPPRVHHYEWEPAAARRATPRVDLAGGTTAMHHHDHAHAHGAPDTRSRAFAIGFGLNGAFVLVEIVFGLRARSLALLADAGHNLGDVLGLAMAWGA